MQILSQGSIIIPNTPPPIINIQRHVRLYLYIMNAMRLYLYIMNAMRYIKWSFAEMPKTMHLPEARETRVRVALTGGQREPPNNAPLAHVQPVNT